MLHKSEHKFLTYEKSIVNFVFSFSWDVAAFSFDDLVRKLIVGQESKWQITPLFKRPLWWVNESIQATYHPTIVSEKLRALINRDTIDKQVLIQAPFREGVFGPDSLNYKSLNADLKYDLRIYENGVGTCTLSFYSEELDFEKILLLQHLATSISHGSLETANTTYQNFTHAYLKTSHQIKAKYNISDDYIHLSQLFTLILDSFEGLQGVIWNEKRVLFEKADLNSNIQNWQIPYVVSIFQISSDDLNRVFNQQDRLLTKEIGAIGIRLTYDNGSPADEYFTTLRREYIYSTLGCYYDSQDQSLPPKKRLRNYSHSNNLFYTFGRRAAVAFTDNLEAHPSYFAIPTFINVLELLRSRWHLGTIANLKLDETFERIAHREDINNLVDEIFECRLTYGLFLQNPTPYLFDSGAVTEISDAADEVFWLAKIAQELERKLKAMDRLVEIIYTKKSLGKWA